MSQQLPKDPVMLLSFVNTQLRDQDASLEELCARYQVDKKELDEKRKLEAAAKAEEAKKTLGIKSYRVMRRWYWSIENKSGENEGEVNHDGE